MFKVVAGLAKSNRLAAALFLCLVICLTLSLTINWYFSPKHQIDLIAERMNSEIIKFSTIDDAERLSQLGLSGGLSNYSQYCGPVNCIISFHLYYQTFPIIECADTECLHIEAEVSVVLHPNYDLSDAAILVLSPKLTFAGGSWTMAQYYQRKYGEPRRYVGHWNGKIDETSKIPLLNGTNTLKVDIERARSGIFVVLNTIK